MLTTLIYRRLVAYIKLKFVCKVSVTVITSVSKLLCYYALFCTSSIYIHDIVSLHGLAVIIDAMFISGI